MPESQQAVDLALIAAYQQQTQALRERLSSALARLWRALGAYREPDMHRFAAQAVPLVVAGQRQMSSLTVGYHGARRTQVVGRSRTVRVDPTSVSGAAARLGVDPTEVYGRPFHQVWRDLASAQEQRDAHYQWLDPGGPGSGPPPLPPADYVQQAFDSGLHRVVQTGLTDLQLAKTQTSLQVLADDASVSGYRRVLEGEASCGLCIVASTLRYTKGMLLPIHPGCDCSVAEIYGDEDPGLVIDEERLAAAHAAIQERFGASNAGARIIPGTGAGTEALQYRDVLITHQHGELGPILGVRGQAFTGPNDIS